MSSATGGRPPAATRRSIVAVMHTAIGGNAPPDDQDSLRQLAEVSAALQRLGHSPVAVPVGLDLAAARRWLLRRRPTLVFNLVESLEGSGRLIQLVPALLDDLAVAYTGARHEAMFLTSNKRIAKQLLSLHGLPTPEEWSPATKRKTARWIVKSVWEDASIGIDDASVVDTADVPSALTERSAQPGSEWFAERFVDGREFNVSLIETERGLKVLPVAEIQFADFPAEKPRIVGYAAKWQPDSLEYQRTIRVFVDPLQEAALLEQLGWLARRCWSIFGLNGYARVDFRVDEAGRPWILEVNANPCLSSDAGFAAALATAGASLDEAVAWLVGDGLRRAQQTQQHRQNRRAALRTVVTSR